MSEITALKRENEDLKNALIRIADRQINPPVVMMEPEKVVKKYHDICEEMGKFKKLFWRIYWR